MHVGAVSGRRVRVAIVGGGFAGIAMAIAMRRAGHGEDIVIVEQVPPMAFRPLEGADLQLLHRWLNEPGVARWWEGDDVSPAAVRRDYGRPWRDGTEHWLALDQATGAPIGWLQCYPSAHSEEEAPQWWAAGVDRTAAGIDYLLGDPTRRGRGIGSAMIAAFVQEVVFARHPGWTQACASPYAANVASWRALERAGFRHVGEGADEDGTPWRIMVIDR